MEAAPRQLRQHAARRVLEITWPDGRVDALAYRRLREACRCADCTRARRAGTSTPVSPAIELTRIAPMGQYAVQLGFSDGHDRGIFPWAYLRELGERLAPR